MWKFVGVTGSVTVLEIHDIIKIRLTFSLNTSYQIEPIENILCHIYSSLKCYYEFQNNDEHFQLVGWRTLDVSSDRRWSSCSYQASYRRASFLWQFSFIYMASFICEYKFSVITAHVSRTKGVGMKRIKDKYTRGYYQIFYGQVFGFLHDRHDIAISFFNVTYSQWKVFKT
jgi:hypothetical protein